MRSDLSSFYCIIYTVQKGFSAIYFVMRIVEMGGGEIYIYIYENFAYKSLVRPILEYGVACQDLYSEGQLSAIDRLQNKADKFAQHSVGLDWKSFAQRRKISNMCAIFKASTCERAWKAIGDSLQAPSYLSKVDQYRKFRARNKEETSGNTPFEWVHY